MMTFLGEETTIACVSHEMLNDLFLLLLRDMQRTTVRDYMPVVHVERFLRGCDHQLFRVWSGMILILSNGEYAIEGRHSFCTYHVALTGSADRTATLLTHRGSVSTLYDHYRGNATNEQAKCYFSVRP